MERLLLQCWGFPPSGGARLLHNSEDSRLQQVTPPSRSDDSHLEPGLGSRSVFGGGPPEPARAVCRDASTEVHTQTKQVATTTATTPQVQTNSHSNQHKTHQTSGHKSLQAPARQPSITPQIVEAESNQTTNHKAQQTTNNHTSEQTTTGKPVTRCAAVHTEQDDARQRPGRPYHAVRHCQLHLNRKA